MLKVSKFGKSISCLIFVGVTPHSLLIKNLVGIILLFCQFRMSISFMIAETEMMNGMRDTTNCTVYMRYLFHSLTNRARKGSTRVRFVRRVFLAFPLPSFLPPPSFHPYPKKKMAALPPGQTPVFVMSKTAHTLVNDCCLTLA